MQHLVSLKLTCTPKQRSEY